ncbi:hypothetical protein F5Y19DRAFT_286032 [Xylariaceae sp. FL1651]|nr:hypothetical protein F5Y19DRAFT_286032 [Xylariaceae sp. FL1651]
MSTIMTMALPPRDSIMSTKTTLSASQEPSCPNCGLSLPLSLSDPHAALLQAQREIEDLQAQVRLLNQKATAAVDRWADYEDELSRLRAASTSTNSTSASGATNTTAHSNTTAHAANANESISSSSTAANINNRPHTPAPSVPTSSPRTSFLGAGAASRISQLLSPRKSASIPVPSTAPGTPAQRGSLASVSSPALPLGSPERDRSSNGRAAAAAAAETRELISALTNERRLRAAAEEKLHATSQEVEELSASLFEQANTMVATERRARAALEEQVSLLGQRDKEKRERIERLEGAVRRIERARSLLRSDDHVKEEEKEEDEKEAGEEEEDDEKKEEGEDNNERGYKSEEEDRGDEVGG